MGRYLSQNSPENSTKLTIEGSAVIDLTGLPPETQIELRKLHATSFIELQKRAQELGIDSIALSKRMNDSINNVAKATADGTSATLTGVYKDSMGHTEFIVGNTETAQRGKITSAQRGNPNHTLKYVLIAAITLVILVSILKQ